MNKLLKKWATIMLAAAMAVAFMPAGFGVLGGGAAGSGPGVEKAYADSPTPTTTENVEFLNDHIKGLDSSGKATPGTTLSLTTDAYSIIYHYGWDTSTTILKWELWNGSTLVSTTKSEIFAVPNDAGGKTIKLCLEDTDGNVAKSKPIQIPLIVNIIQGPSISGVQYSYGILSKNIIVNLSGYGIWNTNADSSYNFVNTKTIKLTCNGKVIGTKSTDGTSITFAKVPMKYNKVNTIKVEIFMKVQGKTISGGSKTYTIPKEKLGKNKVFATKLSKNKAIVRWNGVTGATGYKIYKGSKLVKTVKASKRVYTVSKKKAGTARYKVVPILKSGSTTYKGTSNIAKPKTNKATWSHSKNPNSYSYGEGNFVVTKVQLKGRYYYVSGFAVNNRIYFKLAKYKKLSFKLYVDGKLAMKKTYRNKKMNLKPGKIRTMKFKIKGKPNKDLANLSVSVSVGYTPVWK